MSDHQPLGNDGLRVEAQIGVARMIGIASSGRHGYRQASRRMFAGQERRMLIFGILPFGLWVYGPHWLRPFIIVFGIVMLVLLTWLVWRHIRINREDMENWPSRSEYRWPEGWDITRYHRALLTYLKVDDWRIRSAEAIDADHLLLCIHRDRYRLPVLLVRPGVAPREADIDYLREIQRRDTVWDGALISDAPHRTEPLLDANGAKLLLLNYDDLPMLSNILELTTETQEILPSLPSSVAQPAQPEPVPATET